MKYPIIDLHQDISLYFMYYGAGQRYNKFSDDISGREGDIPKYKDANIRVIFASIFPGIHSISSFIKEGEDIYGKEHPRTSFGLGREIIFEHLKIYYNLSRLYSINIVLNQQKLNNIIKSGTWKLGFVLHIEGADPIVEIEDLELFHKLGIRSIGLTWNKNNKYAAACNSKKDYGLTDDGAELVKFANKQGILIDLSHASKKTVMDVLEISKKPVMISHTNLRRYVDSPRNIDDEIIYEVSRRNGVIGISLISSLIKRGERPTIEDVARQIISLIDDYSSKLPAIGTDYFGLLGTKPPIGMDDCRSIQKLLDVLREYGVDEETIKNVAYRNAERVLRSTLI